MIEMCVKLLDNIKNKLADADWTEEDAGDIFNERYDAINNLLKMMKVYYRMLFIHFPEHIEYELQENELDENGYFKDRYVNLF
jgi:hypothetical protein